MQHFGLCKAKLICLLGLLLIAGCSRDKLPPGMTFTKTKYSFQDISWSPDSQRLVGSTMPFPYSGINIGRPPSEVYVWEPANDTYIQVSDQEFTQWNSNPVWSPRGEQIAYYSQSEFGPEYRIGLVDLDTMTRTGILGFGPTLAWFPDGERIAVENSAICVLELETKRCPDLWRPPYGQLAHDVAVSPDGHQIAVLTKVVGQDTNRSFIISEDGRSAQIVAELSIPIRDLDWSPDGQWITFSLAGRGIRAVRADGSCMTEPLAFSHLVDRIVLVNDIKWSPDGRRIAISANWHRDAGVFFFDTDSELIRSWLRSGTCSE
jgi:Tol biopolymer transport system component